MGAMANFRTASLAALAVALMAGASTRSPAQDHAAALHRMTGAPPIAQERGAEFKYLGPGSCSASACHGGIQPRDTTKVLQNEYSTWIVQDRHSRAYTVLTQPLAKRMARILKIGDPESAQRCLVCHALSVTPAQSGRKFDISEGVSCESCHGPSSAWLGPHVQASAKHADMVRLGLVDNKNLVARSERCLTCHLGAPGMEVDHEMLAAGHPDLTFELDSFSSIEPPHWVEKASDSREPIDDKLLGVRIWSVGQAVQLRQSMLRLARRARGKVWPEYTEMDCFTCHHSLTKSEDSWRQQEGYDDRRPGNPPYNPARYVVFRHVARVADPPTTAELEHSLSEIDALVAELQPDRAVLAARAEHAAALAGHLTTKLQDARYTRTETAQLMREIAADGDAISFQGERAAEQATMALDSLYLASANQGPANPELRQSLDEMYKLLENPSAYSAPKFAAQMKKVSAKIRE